MREGTVSFSFVRLAHTSRSHDYSSRLFLHLLRILQINFTLSEERKLPPDAESQEGQQPIAQSNSFRGTVIFPCRWENKTVNHSSAMPLTQLVLGSPLQ